MFRQQVFTSAAARLSSATETLNKPITSVAWLDFGESGLYLTLE